MKEPGGAQSTSTGSRGAPPRANMMRRKVAWTGLALLLASALFFGVFPPLLAWRMSQHSGALPPPMNAQAQSLHSKLLVADLHAATLVWSRDLSTAGGPGHVDVPRLTDGGVALQVFSATSHLGWYGDLHRTVREQSAGPAFDLLTPLAVAQLWPSATWSSRLERVLYQGERLRQAVRLAGMRLIAVRGQPDLDRLLLARSHAEANGLTRPIGVMLAVNGADALEGRIENLDRLFDAGFRMAVPPSLPSQRGPDRGPGSLEAAPDEAAAEAAGGDGLTPIGRQWLRRMEEKGMVVDVAHVSPATLQMVTANATRPVVASHTGLRGACDSPRNLTDEEARGIAATGGLIGIGFWREAVCDVSVDAIVRSIRYAVGVVGIDHVAFGSNFDGGAPTPVDAAGLAHITHGLTAAGFSDEDIAKIAGGNVLRVLRRVLPPR